MLIGATVTGAQDRPSPISAADREAFRGERERGKPEEAELIRRFDRDGDGQISELERAAARQSIGSGDARVGRRKPHRGPAPEEMMKQFDQDGDGQLSDKEQQVAREHMKKLREGQEAMRSAMTKRFDRNEDGRLTGDERQEARQAHGRLLQRFDKDQDGRLNEQEHQAAIGSILEEGERITAWKLRRFDKDKDGRLDEAEKAQYEASRQKMIARFDKDGDGRLSGAERDAARKTFHHKKAGDSGPNPQP